MRALYFALLSLAAGTVLGAEVYKSVDEHGVVTFSDRPGQFGEERIVVATRAPTPPPPAVGAPQPAAAPAVEGGEIEREPTAEEVAAERRRNCEIATERAERYRISRRLYRALPDGEREYLSEEETLAARADAEADVRDWCS